MNIDVVSRCFPSNLKHDVEIIFRNIDFCSKREVYNPFDVFLDGEVLVIPQRMYCDEAELNQLIGLSPTQQQMIFCLFSRHHDGYVRERCIRQVIGSSEKFVAPFIVQLIGEYVFEIIDLIFQRRESIDKAGLASFIRENPNFYSRTESRVYSYWDCYFRRDYPKYRKHLKPKGNTVADYPGVQMLKHIKQEVLQE